MASIAIEVLSSEVQTGGKVWNLAKTVSRVTVAGYEPFEITTYERWEQPLGKASSSLRSRILSDPEFIEQIATAKATA